MRFQFHPAAGRIDEAAWASFYSTTSRPFARGPATGNNAIKVINHLGDEVLKVFDL